MNILMITNTYLPFVGGVERSLEIFTSEFRKNGNRVLIVAPEFENNPVEEIDVIRVPSLRHFNGTEFSVQLPIPGILHAALKNVTPDIIHSHHPFMLGDTALRVSAEYQIPIVFTHHTFYEKYTHYVLHHSEKLKRFIAKLATEYANLCNLVFAPSVSVASELIRRGVTTEILTLPTGIDIELFKKGSGIEFRHHYGIPQERIILGTVSRIAPEKNPHFLVDAIKQLMEKHAFLHFLVVGDGPSKAEIINDLHNAGLSNRCTFTGVLQGLSLIDAYHAMNLFLFSSQTETQGLVITEAMAAGIPVVAVKGPGVEDIVTGEYNGQMVDPDIPQFCHAVEWFLSLDVCKVNRLKKNAMETAKKYSKVNSARAAYDAYCSLIEINKYYRLEVDSLWEKAKRVIKTEMELLKIMTKATGAAINTEKDI